MWRANLTAAAGTAAATVFCSRAGRARRKLRAMKTKIFFIAALSLARVCPAQTPSPTTAQSSWQLAPPFELGSSLPSPSSAVSISPERASTATAPIVQTKPVQSTPPRPAASESTPVPTASGRKSSSKTSYVEGPVWVLTFVKTKSGLGDEYFKAMTRSLRPIYDEEKNRKIILDYKILSGGDAGDRDFNIIIMVEYANTAALDELRERAEPIIDKIIGPIDKRRDIAAKRLDIREILATKTMREIWLK